MMRGPLTGGGLKIPMIFVLRQITFRGLHNPVRARPSIGYVNL